MSQERNREAEMICQLLTDAINDQNLEQAQALAQYMIDKDMEIEGEVKFDPIITRNELINRGYHPDYAEDAVNNGTSLAECKEYLRVSRGINEPISLPRN